MHVRAVALALIASAGFGCSTNTQMNISRAPGFASEHPRVSVFAVLRNGRPSAEDWNELGPRLTATFSAGVATCEAGFGNEMRAASPELFGEVEIEVKTDGISDESLARAAEKSKGDLVVVFEVWGGIGGGRKKEPSSGSNAPAMTMGREDAVRAEAGPPRRSSPTRSSSRPGSTIPRLTSGSRRSRCVTPARTPSKPSRSSTKSSPDSCPPLRAADGPGDR